MVRWASAVSSTLLAAGFFPWLQGYSAAYAEPGI
jgi:hypothetical protein